MGPPLSDDIWMRRGISLLWDAEALATVCTPKQVVSLRQFLLLHAAGWPDADLSLVNDVRPRRRRAGKRHRRPAARRSHELAGANRYPAIVSSRRRLPGAGPRRA